MAEVASLEEHNVALVTELLQAQKQNKAILGPILTAHCIGGGQESTPWVGGSKIT